MRCKKGDRKISGQNMVWSVRVVTGDWEAPSALVRSRANNHNSIFQNGGIDYCNGEGALPSKVLQSALHTNFTC